MKKLIKKIFTLVVVLFVSTSTVACDSTEEPTQDSVVPPSDNQGGELETIPVSKPSFTAANFANGAKSYINVSYDEKAKILGILESYAINNNLTGLTLFENGSYMMHQSSVLKGSDIYIPGYGFGVLKEGYLTGPMTTEENPDWQWYYHLLMSSDIKTINIMDRKNSQVWDLNSYCSSSYWGTQMNETKDGYEWVAVQSNSERPIPVDGVQEGDQILASKFKFELKVGAEYKYNTNSTVPAIAAFNGREVALEDYVTAYKMLWTKAYGMARAADNLDGSGAIKGSLEYYEASTADKTPAELDAVFEQYVGIKTYVENGKAWMEVEFTTPCNQFYAMYYLSSALSTPVPADFIATLGDGNFADGMKVYGNFTDGGWTPVDTYLSSGAYTLERWDADQQIVFKKNPYYDLEGADHYKIAGIHYEISKSAIGGPSDEFFHFLEGNIHEVTIPLNQLEKYINDSRTTPTTGDSTYKLNINSCTQEEWVKLFGVNGSIVKTNEYDYWQCEPAMSNDNFLRGLSYALNRKELAKQNGLIPSTNYLVSNYIVDPENGISYNSTQYHKDAIKSLVEGTQNGYNLEYAQASFKKAAEELIAAGHYQVGDKITIEIAWMYASDEKEMHNYIKKYFEDAFNNADTGLTLEVSFWVGAAWSDVYYNKMMVGQFDIAFGSISSSSSSPIEYFEALRSDNSSGFTLNWSGDTNVVSEEIFYDGMYWSFNALWIALNEGGYFENGQFVVR